MRKTRKILLKGKYKETPYITYTDITDYFNNTAKQK